MATANVLYSDRLVEMTQEAICFKSYYFPFGDKRVRFADINSITTEKPGLLNGRYRIQGSSNLRTWFPRDWRRPARPEIFLARLRGSSRCIGFTVEDAGQVKQILRDKRLLSHAAAS